MRRDYTNRRTVFFLNRTIFLTLQIVRCNNSRCSRYKQPHRPEMEWHYAMPGTKFALDSCGVIFAAHLDGKSNLSIHRTIREYGFPCASRTVANVVSRYQDVLTRAASPWSTEVMGRLKAERKAILDILIACDQRYKTCVLVRECFSNCILAGTSISKSKADEELSILFHSVIDRLPVPVVQILSSPVAAIRTVAAKMWPNSPIVDVEPDGVLGQRTTRNQPVWRR